jgi:hypothetical protein
MRVIVTGDRFWFRHRLAAQVLGRLVAQDGPDLVIVHGNETGVAESFATAAPGLGVAAEAHPAEWDRLGERAGPIRNQEMVDAGAARCLAFHRAISASKSTKGCCRQAIQAGIPTYLIDSAKGVPRRLRADDPRLR